MTRRRRNPRGDAAVRGAARGQGGDPKVEAWRRGLVVPPDTAHRTHGPETDDGPRWRAWWDRPGVEPGIMVDAYPLRGGMGATVVYEVHDLALRSSDDEVARLKYFTGSPFLAVAGTGPDWLHAPVQQAVARAYVGATARSNPSPDQRRRELERRAALGDPEAQAQLQALIYRAPATGHEALDAADPVQQAWTAWQQGRGTREQYEIARFWAASGDGGQGLRPSGAHYGRGTPWREGAHPPPDRMSGGGQFGERASASHVLDTPQADAVLQAYTAATGKPWNTALTIGRGGPGTGFEGWRRGQKPTVKQAAQVVVAYYRSLGWQERSGMPGTTSGKQLAHAPLVSPDGQQRVIFSRTTLRRERREPDGFSGGRWQRDYQRDPSEQVGVIDLAHALMLRAIRARDWRANPRPGEVDGSYVLQPPGATGQIGPERGRPVRDGIAKFVSPHGSVRFVAYQGGKAIGGLQVVVAPGKAPIVAMAYVLPGHRRAGVASRIWARAKKVYPGVVHAAESERSQDAAAWISSLPNPWLKSGYVRAHLLVYRQGQHVWTWELGEWGEVEKPKQIRDALHDAARLWRDSGMAQPGDDVQLHLGNEVERLRVERDGARLKLVKA